MRTLTVLTTRAHDPVMRAHRREIPAAVIIAALLATTSGSVCAGWASSPDARMACCAMAGHDGDGQAADDCCAAGKQRQHSETPLSNATLAPASLVALLTPSVPLAADGIARAWRPRQHPPDTPRSSTDTRLLLSVFVI